MRARPFSSVPIVLALVACATDPTLGAGEGALGAAEEARTLVRGAPSALAPQTDEAPTYEMEVLGENGPIASSPGRVRGGALVRDGVVWVRADGALVRADGSVLDVHVLPELAVDASGTQVAYPRAQLEGGGVYVVDVASGARRLVSVGLASADRPLFLPGGRVVVIGARASGIAGVWILDPSGVAQPESITNGALRTGRPFGAAFVPPPVTHTSMRLEGAELVYDDGRAERRVRLPEAP